MISVVQHGGGVYNRVRRRDGRRVLYGRVWVDCRARHLGLQGGKE